MARGIDLQSAGIPRGSMDQGALSALPSSPAVVLSRPPRLRDTRSVSRAARWLRRLPGDDGGDDGTMFIGHQPQVGAEAAGPHDEETDSSKLACCRLHSRVTIAMAWSWVWKSTLSRRYSSGVGVAGGVEGVDLVVDEAQATDVGGPPDPTNAVKNARLLAGEDDMDVFGPT